MMFKGEVNMQSLLEIKDMEISYNTSLGPLRAVDGISFEVASGESFGLVGESGCGKSTSVRGIMGVMDKNARLLNGEIKYNGVDLTTLSQSDCRDFRWNQISFIPQAAMDSFNPVYSLFDQFREIYKLKGGISSRKEVRKKAETLYKAVGLAPEMLDSYPHEYSGGMKQRAAIAMALTLDPGVIIADEPVTALDVIVQKQVLQQLTKLKKDKNLAIIMITHDISVVAQICDSIAVMYAGKIVEKGSAKEVLQNTFHPYTLGLKNSFPDISKPDKKLVSIKGTPPSLLDPPSGCRFYPRCPFREEVCQQQQPALEEVSTGHVSACFRHEEIMNIRSSSEEVETWETVEIL